MPYKCCVPKCCGNYDSTEKVHIFGFPQDNKLKEKWIKAIPRKDFTCTKNSKVCEKHFQADCIEWETSGYDDKAGKVISAPLRRPKLKEGSIPSIFPSCPSYLSSPQVVPRTSREEKLMLLNEKHLARAVTESQVTKEQYDKSRTFLNFEEFLSKVDVFPCSKFWNCINREDKVHQIFQKKEN